MIEGMMRPVGEVPVSRVADEVDLGNATVSLWGKERDLTVRIETGDTAQPVGAIEIEFDPAKITPASASWTAGTEGRIEIAADRLTISPRGAARCDLEMRVGSGRAEDVRIGSSPEGGTRRVRLLTAR